MACLALLMFESSSFKIICLTPLVRRSNTCCESLLCSFNYRSWQKALNLEVLWPRLFHWISLWILFLDSPDRGLGFLVCGTFLALDIRLEILFLFACFHSRISLLCHISLTTRWGLLLSFCNRSFSKWLSSWHLLLFIDQLNFFLFPRTQLSRSHLLSTLDKLGLFLLSSTLFSGCHLLTTFDEFNIFRWIIWAIDNLRL